MVRWRQEHDQRPGQHGLADDVGFEGRERQRSHQNGQGQAALADEGRHLGEIISIRQQNRSRSPDSSF